MRLGKLLGCFVLLLALSVSWVPTTEAAQSFCLQCRSYFGLVWCEVSDYGFQQCEVINGFCVGIGECSVGFAVSK